MSEQKKAPRSLIYYIGIFIVAFTTFFFVGYILPSLPPLIGMLFFSGMLTLIVVGWSLRIRRLRKVSKEIQPHNQPQTELTTQDYIQEVERLMGRK